MVMDHGFDDLQILLEKAWAAGYDACAWDEGLRSAVKVPDSAMEWWLEAKDALEIADPVDWCHVWRCTRRGEEFVVPKPPPFKIGEKELTDFTIWPSGMPHLGSPTPGDRIRICAKHREQLRKAFERHDG